MALENFNPEIWSAKLFVRLRKALVFANAVNNDYEGEIRNFGDTVRVNEIGAVTISDYTKYSDLTWQELESAQKVLYIDQAKSFSFEIDDVDAAQNNPKVMNAAMSESAYAIGDTIDSFLAGLYTGAGVTNSSNLGTATSGVSVSSGNVIDKVSYVARYMTEKNVPQEGRIAAVPPWFHQKLLLAETGGIGATGVPKITDDGVVLNGWVGRFGGFDFLISNNIKTTSTVNHTMWFNRSAITYAGQVTKVEALRRENRFSDGIKGLYVYGGKVMRSEALAVLHAIEASG